MPVGSRKPQKKYKKRPQQQYVPGYGGMVGRGLGYVAKTFTNNGSVANKALKLAKKVAYLVNVEEKYHEIQNTAQPDYSGIINNLNAIPQGITDSGRIGDSVKMLQLKMRVWVIGIVATGPEYARMIVFFDDQSKISSAADLLETTGTAYAPLSYKHYDKRFQSQILYDKHMIFDQVANPAHYIDIDIPIGKHTQFSAATSTVNTGRLSVLMISNQAVAANAPLFTFQTRLTYTDN